MLLNSNINNNNKDINQQYHDNFKRLRLEIKSPSGSIRGHLGEVLRMSLQNIRAVARSNRRNFDQTKLATFCQSNQEQEQQLWQANKTGSEQAVKLSAIISLESHYYLEDLIRSEKNKCVLYTTSLGIIRRTHSDSKTLR